MKNRLILCAILSYLLISPSACKKYINHQEENIIVNLVTNGTWRVTKYLENQTDITDSFAGYVFQFNQNGTVQGILGGQSTAGTWVANVDARTIQSDCPSAGDPLKELNYTWKITDSYSDSVSAQTAVDSTYNILELHKN
jgi:hypothetical protein